MAAGSSAAGCGEEGIGRPSSDDVGGRALWLAVAAGTATMLVNIAVLIVADVLVGASAFGSYPTWIGRGLVAGGLLGLAGCGGIGPRAGASARRSHLVGPRVGAARIRGVPCPPPSTARPVACRAS